MPGNNLKLADDFALEYDNSALKNKWNGPALIFNLLNDQLKPNSKILDLGIGTGESSRRFQQAGHKITGLDGSQKMIAECKRKGIASEWIVCDIEKSPLPMNDNQFDAVISNAVFHLVHPLSQVFIEISRVLKLNGIFAFTFEAAKNTFKSSEIEPGVWQKNTGTGVQTFKHKLSYINNLLSENKLCLITQQRFLAFLDKKSNSEFYFTAMLTRLR